MRVQGEVVVLESAESVRSDMLRMGMEDYAEICGADRSVGGKDAGGRNSTVGSGHMNDDDTERRF